MTQEFTKIAVDEALAFARVLLKDGNTVRISKNGAKTTVEWQKPPKEGK